MFLKDVTKDARVVDQDVEATEFAEGGIHHLRRVVGARDRAVVRCCAPAARHDLLHDLVCDPRALAGPVHGAAEVVDDHDRPFSRERRAWDLPRPPPAPSRSPPCRPAVPSRVSSSSTSRARRRGETGSRTRVGLATGSSLAERTFVVARDRGRSMIAVLPEGAMPGSKEVAVIVGGRRERELRAPASEGMGSRSPRAPSPCSRSCGKRPGCDRSSATRPMRTRWAASSDGRSRARSSHARRSQYRRADEQDLRKKITEADPELAKQTILNSVGAFLVDQRAAACSKTICRRAAARHVLFTNASAAFQGYPLSGAFAIAFHGKSGLAGAWRRARSTGRPRRPLSDRRGDREPARTGSARIGSPESRRTTTWRNPARIAETYLHLHRQHRSTWTFEAVMRPWVERW